VHAANSDTLVGMSQRRPPRQYIEGPQAARRFDRAMGQILSVPKDELAKREAEYQESRQDKDRPGPRPTKK